VALDRRGLARGQRTVDEIRQLAGVEAPLAGLLDTCHAAAQL
jgi:hypothetical protein